MLSNCINHIAKINKIIKPSKQKTPQGLSLIFWYLKNMICQKYVYFCYLIQNSRQKFIWSRMCRNKKRQQVKDQQIYAIKKIEQPFQHKILTKRMLREIHQLKLLKHQNIMKIDTLFMPLSRQTFNHVYISFEFMDSDLHQILRSQQQLTKKHFRFFMYQIMRGLKYLHSAGVVHRDLKPRNLLVNKNCDLEFCDFGLARSLTHKSKSNQLTDYVAIRWYRAPELLLGSCQYQTSVDMWSVGCIFAQMILRKPFMKGKSTKQQLQIIVKQIGVEGLESIDSISAGAKTLLKKLSNGKGQSNLKNIFSKVEKKQLDLLTKLLAIDPKKRISAAQALKHPYFDQLKDQADQPQTKPFISCDFQFQLYNLNTQQLKDILYQQILTYNYPQFAKQYEQKRIAGKSLISHILNNSNKNNRDPELIKAKNKSIDQNNELNQKQMRVNQVNQVKKNFDTKQTLIISFIHHTLIFNFAIILNFIFHFIIYHHNLNFNNFENKLYYRQIRFIIVILNI